MEINKLANSAPLSVCVFSCKEEQTTTGQSVRENKQ